MCILNRRFVLQACSLKKQLLSPNVVVARKGFALKKRGCFEEGVCFSKALGLRCKKRSYLEETIIWQNKRFYKHEVLLQNGKSGPK